MRWAGDVVSMGEERGVYRVLVGKPEGKRPPGRPRRRWVDDIRLDLQEVGCRYMDWSGLAQDRNRWRTLVSAVMNFRVPWNVGNFLTSCKPVGFSRRTLHPGVSKYMSRKFFECGFSENRGRMPDLIARCICVSYFPQLLSDLGKICVHRFANCAVR